MSVRGFSRHTILVLTWLMISIGDAAGNRVRRPAEGLRVNPERLEAGLLALADIGKTSQGGVSRPAFSEADLEARRFVIGRMEEAGLVIRLDEAGNIIGRLENSNGMLRALAAGSHLDSVPEGGRYDGALGVMAAIECCRTLKEHRVRMRHPLEVIVFIDEEGGLVGSRAMLGELDDRGLGVIAYGGKTVREGIAAAGGNPEKIPTAARSKADLAAYLELHIEQGNVLDAGKIRIGAVEGIVGISRWEVGIEGAANHAGTTPMDSRQDALLAAAHLITAVNRIVTAIPGRQVGTVGWIKAEPGAVNVIPGRVSMSLELRDLSAEKVDSMFLEVEKEASLIGQKTKTRISFRQPDAPSAPALLDPVIRRLIADSAADLGLSCLEMPSGAGHDAQNMARLAPTGMIFIPSAHGISHSPKEFSRPEDVEAGANVLLLTILKLDSR